MALSILRACHIHRIATPRFPSCAGTCFCGRNCCRSPRRAIVVPFSVVYICKHTPATSISLGFRSFPGPSYIYQGLRAFLATEGGWPSRCFQIFVSHFPEHQAPETNIHRRVLHKLVSDRLGLWAAPRAALRACAVTRPWIGFTSHQTPTLGGYGKDKDKGELRKRTESFFHCFVIVRAKGRGPVLRPCMRALRAAFDIGSL